MKGGRQEGKEEGRKIKDGRREGGSSEGRWPIYMCVCV
jgi:hypothetical protein